MKEKTFAMKPLTLVLTFVLVIGISVAGTLAWLTAKSDPVTNTFTSAKMFDNASEGFTLWEHEVELQDDGRYVLNEEETDENTYKILPGVNVPKDPTVDIQGLKENAYLYVKVTDALVDGLSYDLDDKYWSQLAGYENVWVYNNGQIIEGAMEEQSFTVNILKDKQVVVDDDYSYTPDPESPTAVKLSFEAFLVQATGNGANAVDAWGNTYGKSANN